MNKQRLLGALVLSGMVASAVSTMAGPAHAAAPALRSAFNLVAGENPTIDPLNAALAEARWQAPVRTVSIFRMDPARFPASIIGQPTPPCVATLSIGTLHGTAPVVNDGLGHTQAELRDQTPGANGQLGKVDVVCDWIDGGGAAQHHETHWAGELGTAPVASVTSIVDLGGVRVGQLGLGQDITLANVGNAPLHVASAALAGVNASEFNVLTDGCSGATVAAGASCAVNVRVAPTIAGARRATLTFTDDAPDASQVTTLKGAGIQPGLLLSPLTLDFGSQRVTTNAVKTITATNNGTDTLNIGSWTLAGNSDFKIVSNGCANRAIAVNAGCSVTVRFSPSITGARTASINVNSDAPSTIAHKVAIKGKGSVV